MSREMTEAERYRVFGLEPPEEDPAEETPAEDGEPVGETVNEDEGANEQEAAEPAEDEDEPAEGDPDEEPDDDAGEPDEPAEQSREERARNAARRRKAEQEAAIHQALEQQRQQIDAELKDAFGWAGFKDGTKPIESLDELKAYRQRVQSEQLAKDLQAGKLTPEALGQLVRQEIAAQQPAPAAPPAQDDGAFQRQVEAELAEIRKYDPSIRSVEDRRALDRAEAFTEQVTKHGHTFLEAYRIAYADRIAEGQARAAAQRTRNAARSKDHMKPTTARGAGDIPVPEEVMRNYRRMMPKATDEQIRKAYQKYARSQKK